MYVKAYTLIGIAYLARLTIDKTRHGQEMFVI